MHLQVFLFIYDNGTLVYSHNKSESTKKKIYQNWESAINLNQFCRPPKYHKINLKCQQNQFTETMYKQKVNGR